MDIYQKNTNIENADATDQRIHFFTQEELEARRFPFGNSVFLNWVVENSEGKVKNKKQALAVIASFVFLLIILFIFTKSMLAGPEVPSEVLVDLGYAIPAPPID
ncbi:MAG: hypothetical protein A2288_02045 [Candidatus Moranbacteria bacterium RIFOXYA12_FULL_44_15]|nr:MAG: hypothetical protein A2288_02045 [Candidatus Moranbacteria bacterium RIFOXYA12_FULL_44_15]OGI35907.1 MAG: hypothetical protein A2259_05000 [Candidatus Moranbacteria bacterium RIFOXYA2_FULL_43_15]